MDTDDRMLLAAMYRAAVDAADPLAALRANLPCRPKGRLVVVGAGKAAARMAAAFETLWDGPLSGAVVTRRGQAVPCRQIRVLEAAHPVPDAAGQHAADTLLSAVSGLSSDDLVVALVSGGGSALLPAPPAGLTLEEEQAMNAALLASGAPIGAMNAVRKHVSRIKGGRLGVAAAPARVLTLVVSDVPGDDPAEVASGPTVASSVTRDDTLALIRNHAIDLPERIMAHLQGDTADAPRPDDPAFAGHEVRVIASARLSLEAAAQRAATAGLNAVILSDAIEGEARDVGLVHAAIVREVALRGRPFAAPVAILSGGETTVTLGGVHGRGGRNTEFLLAFAAAAGGLAGVCGIAADTDGIDGSEDNAGAFADGSSAARMRAAGVDPAAALRRHDAWGAFEAVGDLFVPGPTGTNVNDFRAIVVRDTGLVPAAGKG